MPEIRSFVVEQTRQVKVTAADPLCAGVIARKAFQQPSSGVSDAQIAQCSGWVVSRVRVITLDIREDY